MEVKVQGRVRRPLEGVDASSSDNDAQIGLSQQLEQLVASGASPYGEITRLGRAFWTGSTAAVAAVTAIPTTAHLFSIYNNDVDGGRSLVIDWVAAQCVVSVTGTANQAQLLVNIGQVREAAPTDAAMTIKKMNGLGSGTNDSKVRSLLSTTTLPAATGVAANWLPWGPSASKSSVTANTTPGYGIWAPVDGRIIIPPGRYFGMSVLANTTGETFVCQVGWHERQITLA